VNFGVRQGSVLPPLLFNIYLDDIARINDCTKRKFILVYADDILLIAQSVSELEILSRACEKELLFLDMAINAKKSCCLRIGPRCNVDSANILTHDGCSLRWVAELRYLGVFIARARTFRCSLNYVKRSFFGVVNGLFLKLLNLASETVILELVRSKCMPILLYSLESCEVASEMSNADLRSLDFTFNRLFMKLFKTKSIDVVKACQSFTGSEVPSCFFTEENR